MSGQSTGQVLGATTSGAGVALLPNTGENDVLRVLSYLVIVAGVVAVASFTASRIYRKSAK